MGAEREGVAGPVERPRQPRFRGERGARLGPRFEQRGKRQPHLLQVSRQVLLISFDFNIRQAYSTVIIIPQIVRKCSWLAIYFFSFSHSIPIYAADSQFSDKVNFPLLET